MKLKIPNFLDGKVIHLLHQETPSRQIWVEWLNNKRIASLSIDIYSYSIAIHYVLDRKLYSRNMNKYINTLNMKLSEIKFITRNYGFFTSLHEEDNSNKRKEILSCLNNFNILPICKTHINLGLLGVFNANKNTLVSKK